MNTEKRSSGKIIVMAVIAVSIVVAVWANVFDPVETIPHVEPQVIPPDGVSVAVVTLQSYNRFDFVIPLHGNVVRCEMIQSPEGVALSYSKDSSEVYIRAGMIEGIVTLRIQSDALPLPVEAKVYIEAPTA